jgi:serine/threonine protein kinase
MFEPDQTRDPLEVVAAEFAERFRRGELPSIADYAAQHPDLASDIEEFFPTIAVMERLKAHQEAWTARRALLGGVRLERLGDFRIVGEIGRGGMGIVYEAFQESLNRHVAVKVLPKQSLLDPKQLQRFRREAQTAARLHHTNIVPVFGVGEHEGFHYIVMQRIRGVGLDAVLQRLQSIDAGRGGDSGQAAAESDPGSEATYLARAILRGQLDSIVALPDNNNTNNVTGNAATSLFTRDGAAQADGPVAAADAVVVPPPHGGPRRFGAAFWHSVALIGRQVAEALQYAHAQHTLHRDIKPANLLLDAQGIVWITDFGLAKAMEHDNITQADALVGTLGYMAPEQFSSQGDARSDIYSLGLTLYELLTLQPAYADSDRSRLIGKIAHEEPVRPRKVDPDIPLDLETIVLKAIARDPSRRYQTAGELARDLECFLEDRPIHARRVSAAERLWRWVRRNRALAGLAASVSVSLLLIAVVMGVSYVRTTRANIEEARQRKKAEDISALALEALDNVFQQFAPDRAAPTLPRLIVGNVGKEVSVPVQPVLSKEAAALLEHMLAFYDRLAAQEGGDARLRHKAAESNRRVGDIRQRLGNYKESEAAYLRAIELYSLLADDAGADPDLHVEIARIQNELGNVYWATNQREAGQESYAAALATLEAMSASSPQHRYELARTYYYLGRRPGGQALPPPPGPGEGRGPLGPLGLVFDPRGANRAGHESPTLPLGGGEPGSPPPPSDVDLEKKENSVQQAVRILEKLAAEYPAVPDYRHLLAQCYREIPPLRFFRGLPPAPEASNQALDIMQKLVEEYPDVPDYRYDLGETYAMLAFSPDATDKLAAQRPRELLQKALVISEELVAEHPNIPDYAASQMHIRLALTDALRESDVAGAESSLRKALDIQAALMRRFPHTSTNKFWLAVIRHSLAGFLQQRGQLSEARSALQECITLLKGAMRDDPKAMYIRDVLAQNFMNLADLLRRIGDEPAAAEADRQARELMRSDNARTQ